MSKELFLFLSGCEDWFCACVDSGLLSMRWGKGSPCTALPSVPASDGITLLSGLMCTLAVGGSRGLGAASSRCISVSLGTVVIGGSLEGDTILSVDCTSLCIAGGGAGGCSVAAEPVGPCAICICKAGGALPLLLELVTALAAALALAPSSALATGASTVSVSTMKCCSSLSGTVLLDTAGGIVVDKLQSCKKTRLQ